MGRLIVVGVGAILVVVLGLSWLLWRGGPRHVIAVTEEGFHPPRLTIRVGETVTFRNDGRHDHWPASNIHPTHEVYPEFDAQKPIVPGQSWSFRFDRSGTWRFHDHLYPQAGGLVRAE